LLVLKTGTSGRRRERGIITPVRGMVAMAAGRNGRNPEASLPDPRVLARVKRPRGVFLLSKMLAPLVASRKWGARVARNS